MERSQLAIEEIPALCGGIFVCYSCDCMFGAVLQGRTVYRKIELLEV